MEFEKLTIESARAFDARMKNLKRVYPDHYYDELEKSGYIKLTETLNGKNWYEETFKANGYSFVSELEKYMSSKTENDTKTKEKEKLEIGKLRNDYTLSKWQLKTFWWVFSFGIIGGVYAILSIISALTGETTEQKIQRILESKLKAQSKIENTSIAPTSEQTETLKE